MLANKAFKVHKKVLPNGLTILVKPQHNIPRVESHIWYNVGAKDEEPGEKGFCHLIEHMLFKGTKNLSESDINLISHKLLSYANAFTSHDSTSYTFRMQSNNWKESLALFAECMQNATFKPDVLASEIKAVIEEFGLYQEDYQNQLIENLIAAIWPEHPYHIPVLGLKSDLSSVTTEKLLNFYKKHYHPANAVLVVVGDVNPKDAFESAEKYFAKIKSPSDYARHKNTFQDDTCTKIVKLYREIKTPWCCYAYEIPGFASGQNYIFDMANLLLANGNNSRLYNKLINQSMLAVDVGSLVYEFNERSLLLIFVYPQNIEAIPQIGEIVSSEIKNLQTKPIATWEFESAKKKIMLDYAGLLEDLEKQAILIGNFYITTKNENQLEQYAAKLESLKPEQITDAFNKYFDVCCQHSGQLLPANKACAHKLRQLQEYNEKVDTDLKRKFKRKSQIQPSKWANKIQAAHVSKFTFPKPKTFTLKNGASVSFYNNTQTPSISAILSFKANHMYEDSKLSGIFSLLIRHMLDRTSMYSNGELYRRLESEGVYITSIGDIITIKCLRDNFEKALFYLTHILTNPSFDKHSIVKIKNQIENELTELWDTPLEFVEQLAKEHIYQKHPYGKNPLGNIQTIKNILIADLKKYYAKFISPVSANLVVVGDLSNINLKKILNKNFNKWGGSIVSDLKFPKLRYIPSKSIHIPMQRDQLVMTFIAPSISRHDINFNHMAILDLILTGGPSFSSNSRLFDLREKFGLFYAIGGSLLYNSKEQPGMMIIKTLISSDKMELTKKLIFDSIDNLGANGINFTEFENAKNMLLSSNVEHFESNFKMASTFLFLKKLKINTNLFDKMGDDFSIIKIDDVNEVAKMYCQSSRFSVITVGRVKNQRLVKPTKRP